MAKRTELSRDPKVQELVRLRRAQLSRRSLLAGAGGVGAAAFLSACGTGGGTGGATSSAGGSQTGSGSPSGAASLTPGTDVSDTDKSLYWANWTLYLDQSDDGKSYPTLDAFIEQSGIDVTYSEDIEDNDAYIGKYGPQLERGQDIGADIITLTDWMAARLIRSGEVQKLDAAKIPNGANLRPQLREVDWDPGRQYTYTWQSGFGVIAWNKEKVPNGLKTVSDLWQPDLKGRVEVLSEMRDTMGLILLEQGVDVAADFTEDDFMKGIETLQQQIDSGQIRQVKGNSYKEDLISGDALAVIGWSGDIFQINAEEGDKWGFAIPEAGGTYWSDNLMVPIGATHKSNAEELINYYYDPAVAAQVEAWVNYVCPVEGAKEEMEKIDPDLANSDWIFPSEEFLKTVHFFRTLTPDEELAYSEAFATAIGQ